MSLATKISVLALALSAAAAPTTSLAKRQGSGKRGIAYNYDSQSDTGLFIGQGKISWAYDWDSDSYGAANGVNYIPTLWSDSGDHTGNWQNNAQNAINSGSNTLFSFNEPDNGGQANMSPQDAANAWQQYMQPFAGQAALCAPAITNGVGSGVGFDWLNQFLDACSGCTIDCINVHWYATADATQYFEDYVNQAAGYGKPVWLTEFAVTDSNGNILTDPNQVNPFLQSEMPFLDNNANVAGYAYFYAAEGYLVQNGQLSGYGNTYVYS